MTQGMELIVQVKLKDGRVLQRILNNQRQKLELYVELERVKDNFEHASVMYRYAYEQNSDYTVELPTYEALMKELSEKNLL